MVSTQSSMFKNNLRLWVILGVWRGDLPAKYYAIYSFIYLFTTFFIYNILLTLNLIFTPAKIELIIREIIFYFTEMTVGSKVLTILLMRNKIIEALNLIDCKELVGDYENKEGFLFKAGEKYKLGFTIYAIFSNMAYSSQVLVPIILDLIRGTASELPICKYYFLTNDLRENYFSFWFIYQSFGMYGHMMYNVTIDSFIAGLLWLAIAHVKLFQENMRNLKLTHEERQLSPEIRDKIQIARLNNYLRYFDVIVKYCNIIQEIFSVMLFFQFGVASLIICVVMCGLVLPSSTQFVIFMVMYFFTMTTQIFVPGYLGTLLTTESEKLMNAAYDCEWLIRSDSFKKGLGLFMERAKKPIEITGLKMFPLSLATFSSIMKTAYSFFTLIRNVQDEQ